MTNFDTKPICFHGPGGEYFNTCIPRVLGETLLLYGVRMGIVAESYEKDEWTRHFPSFLTLLGSTYSLTGEPIQDALLGTIFRTTKDDLSATQRSAILDIHQFLLYLRTKLVVNGRDNSHFAEDLGALLTSQPSMHSYLFTTIHNALAEVNMFTGNKANTSPSTDSEVEPTTQQSSTVSASFSIEVEVMQNIFNIFVTAEGVLGNGSKSIKPGDEIWVVKNGPVPLILERDMDGQELRLISTAYVHGVKYNEVFRDRRVEDMIELRII